MPDEQSQELYNPNFIHPECQSPQPHTRWLCVVIATILLIGTALVGTWCWRGRDINQVLPTQTADFQTYRNDQIGFQLRYPADMTVSEYERYIGDRQSDRGVRLRRGDTTLTLSIDRTGWLPDTPSFISRDIISQQEITLHNIPTTQVVSVSSSNSASGGTWALSYIFDVNGHKYLFFSTAKGYYNKGLATDNPIPHSTQVLMEQIINTFAPL